MRSEAIRRTIEHLLKLGFSPAKEPRFAWMATVAEARASLSDKLAPSLRHDAEAMLSRLYADGRRQAALGLRQYGKADAADCLPAECPYTLGEICRQDWYPSAPGSPAPAVEAAAR